MKILIINFFYSPDISAHAYRWEQIACHWASQGHEVEVITGRVQGMPTDRLENGVHVRRVGLIEKPIKTAPVDSKQGNEVLRRFKTYLIRMLRPFYRKFYWPDGYWHWTLSATWAVLKRRNTDYDLIISYYPCMGAHLAAAALRRWRSFHGTRWVADYGDPFSVSTTMQPNNFRVYERFNKFVESYIFKTATAVVFTNAETVEAYRALSSEGINLSVIPHLVDLSKINEATARALKSKADQTRHSDLVNILYVGGFHKGIREPFVLFNLIKNLNIRHKAKYVLRIFGPENGFDLSPQNCPEIIYGGMIEREKAIEMMVAADILINVENRNCVMAPSKVVEYIGTGKPIINIEDSGVKIGELEDYIASGNAISISEIDTKGERLDLVVKFILGHTGKMAEGTTVRRILEDRTLDKIAERYLTIRSGNLGETTS